MKFYVFVMLLVIVVTATAFRPARNARSNTAISFFGRKAVPEPDPEPIKSENKGMFSFGKKMAAPAPPKSAATNKKAGGFSFRMGKKVKQVDEDDDEFWDPDGKEKDIAYKARRVARWMTAPFIFESWDSTEEVARKTIKIKSPPSQRERMYAKLNRGELSQDDIDSIRTNPY